MARKMAAKKTRRESKTVADFRALVSNGTKVPPIKKGGKKGGKKGSKKPSK